MTGLLILAADHRARGVMTVESFGDYVRALEAALPFADGILASAEPLTTLSSSGAVEPRHKTYLSINRTGLAGSAFELDDRLVASVERAASEGWTGIKHMVRIDLSDPLTAPALELLGRVLEDSRALGLEALIEAVPWHDGRMGREVDAIVLAAVIAHDMGSPLLKVPIPDAPAGAARVDTVARIVASVGVPVLFLGGPRRDADRDTVLAEIAEVMEGGAAGVAVGRVVISDPDPATMARLVAEAVRTRSR